MAESSPAAPRRSMISEFARGIAQVGVGNASVLILGLLGTVIAVRLLPAREFGIFVLLFTVAESLLQVSTLGLEEALPKFLSPEEKPELRQGVLDNALTLRLLVTLLVGLVAWLATPLLASYFGESVVDLFPYLIAAFLLLGLTSLFRAALGGLFLFDKVGLTSVVQGVSSFLLVVALVWIFELGLMGLVCARLISLALAAVFAWVSIPGRPRPRVDTGLVRRLVSFGYPLHANSALTFFYERVDTLMVGALLGPALLAYYEVGRRISDALRALSGAFRTVYFPFIAKFVATKDAKRTSELVNNSLRFVAVAGAVGVVVTLFLGRDLLVMLFSSRYAASAPVLVLSMMALAVSQVGTVLGYSLIAVGDRAKPLFVNCIHVGVVLACNYALIPRIGIVGAAVAALVGTVVANPVNAFFLKRRLDFRIREYLTPALIVVALAIAYRWLDAAIWSTGQRLVAAAGVIAVVLAAYASREVAHRAGGRTSEDERWLGRMMAWWHRA